MLMIFYYRTCNTGKGISPVVADFELQLNALGGDRKEEQANRATMKKAKLCKIWTGTSRIAAQF